MERVDPRPRRLLPILPGMMTPSEIDSDIILPEIGLQVGDRSRNLTNISQDNKEITEIIGSQNQNSSKLLMIENGDNNNINPTNTTNFVKPKFTFKQIDGNPKNKRPRHQSQESETSNLVDNVINPPLSTKSLNSRLAFLEKQNQNLTQAIYALSNRVSTVEHVNMSLRPSTFDFDTSNFVNRPSSYRPKSATNNLMAAMKISNELITELGERLRKNESLIDDVKYSSGGWKVIFQHGFVICT